MQKFGNGDKFIRMIKAAFTNIRSKIKKIVSYLIPLPYKNRIDELVQMEWSQICIKTLGVNFGNSILYWKKIIEGIIKKIHITE